MSAAPPSAAPAQWEHVSAVVLDTEGHLAAMQKSILRGVGARNVAVVETLGALHKDLIFGRNVVIINWLTPGDGFVELVRGVRDRRISPDPFVGVIVAASCAFGARIRAALDAGANSFVRLPFSAADIMRHVAAASAAPERFVDAPGYFGPDRRRADDLRFGGPDRRRTPAALLDGETLRSERERMRSTAREALEIKIAMMR